MVNVANKEAGMNGMEVEMSIIVVCWLPLHTHAASHYIQIIQVEPSLVVSNHHLLRI